MKRSWSVLGIFLLLGALEPGASLARPTPAARPTRAPRDVRPARPVRPTRHVPPRRTPVAPTATPPRMATTAPIVSTATPSPTRTPADFSTSCTNACVGHGFSNMRLTWYDAASGGLNLSFYVQPGRCAPLTPDVGEVVSIRMDRWLTERRVDTGRLHEAIATLRDGGSGTTANGGTISVGAFRGWQQVTYRATTPPIAGPQDGAEFPVVFDLCLRVGDQAVKARMVCQEKNRGLLCHEG